MVEAAPTDSSHGAPEETATTHSFPGQPRADDRPVRGVVTIQARDSSPMASERPRSVLLVANAGSLIVDELRPPHTRAEWPAILAQHMDEAWAAKWLSWTLPIEPVDSSSTEVRKRMAEGKDLGDLVLPAVGNYIASRGLYAKG